MITETEVDVLQPVIDLPSRTLTAHELASIIDEHAAALWRGDEDIDDLFYGWFASCWTLSQSLEPEDPPSARSVLAAAGIGIRWYESPTELHGYVAGRSGSHYVVSRFATPLRAKRQPFATARHFEH